MAAALFATSRHKTVRCEKKENEDVEFGIAADWPEVDPRSAVGNLLGIISCPVLCDPCQAKLRSLSCHLSMLV
jgi:hypothetical protein